MSGVVTTLVIIMVSLIAISIIWVVVSAIIKNNSKDVTTGFGSLTTDLDITIAREQGADIFVAILRKSGDQTISQIKFLISNGTQDEELTLDSNPDWAQLSTQSFVLTPVILTSSGAETVSIVPVYGTSEKTIGEIADTIAIQHGTGGTGGELPGGGEELPEGCTEIEDTIEEIQELCNTSVCGSVPSDLCLGEYISCGTCEEGFSCDSGQCISGECNYSYDDCGAKVCGIGLDNCGDLVNCGPLDGLCPAGQRCDSLGACNPIEPLNNGTIDNVYPSEGEAFFFGSTDLIDEEITSYVGNWIKFPGNLEEVACLQIPIYVYEGDYGMAFVVFNFRQAIYSEEDYYIFDNFQDCEDYILATP